MGKFSTMEKRGGDGERPGAVDELKQMRPQEKTVDFGGLRSHRRACL